MTRAWGLSITVLVACSSPAIDEKIDALGGEAEGVEPGEFHRPGQPCTLCHSPYGEGSPEFALGGTVFSDPTRFDRPVEGVEVVVYDSVGDVYKATTNCIGNFYLEKGDKNPQFPLAAEIRCPTFTPAGEPILDGAQKPVFKVITMNSWISRDGSCAGCHTLRGAEVDSVGWIFCNGEADITGNPYPPVPDDCAGVPPNGKVGGGAGGGS